MKQYLLNNLNWLLPLAVTLFFSLLNIILAFCNLNIAKNQRRMQNDVFCFQLYERRLIVYENVKKILSEIIRDGEANNEELRSFLIEIRQARFLFGDDIISNLDSLYTIINKLCVVATKIKQKNDPQRPVYCDQEGLLLEELEKNNSILSEKICAYLSFSNYKLEKKQPKKKKHK